MATLASRQHGVVSRRQLLELGLSSSTIARWINARHLHRLYRGVYAVGHRNLTRESRWMGAVLACGPGAALSHAPAGQLLYIVDRNDRFQIHVSVPPGRTARPAGVLVHRPASLDAVDLTARFNIPVTTPTRTAWDLAAGHSPKLARRAYERAQGRGDLDHARVRSLLAASPSRKGTGLIRELLAAKPPPLSEVRSWLEGLLLHICSEHKLPYPEVGAPLLGYEVDFLWADARFIVEADGGDHLDPTQRDHDNERDFVLARNDYLVRRYSHKAMGREAEVEAEVRGILVERLGRGR